jgi:hypothetical protein
MEQIASDATEHFGNVGWKYLLEPYTVRLTPLKSRPC